MHVYIFHSWWIDGRPEDKSFRSLSSFFFFLNNGCLKNIQNDDRCGQGETIRRKNKSRKTAIAVYEIMILERALH